MRKIFGTDGVRGKANIAPIDSETVLLLGRAAAHVMRRSQGRHRVLIGKDTRVSGYLIETALCSGFSSMGVDVMLVGPLPTPGVAFMTRSMRADAGVMISASHNTYEDNGIKFFGHDGFKLADETEQEIETLMEPGHLDELRASPELIGKAFRIDDAVGRYIVYLKSCLPRDSKFDDLKVVLDCANGAAYRVAPMVFTELGASVLTIGDNPDGRNINSNCGSMHPEVMADVVRKYSADFGLAFDGDADRVIFSDENGEIFDGDQILAILADSFKSSGMLNGDGVVGTHMSNYGLEIALSKMGLNLYRANVGDRYVLAEMQARKLNLGGEQSGHIISLDHNTTGDGLLTGLLITSIIKQSGKPLSHFKTIMEKVPQVLINVPVNQKIPLDELKNVSKTVKKIEDKLAKIGRVLVRYSGTELLVRVMVECQDEKLCNELSQELVEVLKKGLNT
jgi:phosphoglucosamine mutase